MLLPTTIGICLLAALLVIVIGQEPEEVSEVCLGCICEAQTRCNRSMGCHGRICGLFRITEPYWEDAGKPTLAFDEPENPLAYPRCVVDPVCAAQAVRNYMTRFAQDCNHDGKIDCYDYALIHKMGPYSCSIVPPEPSYSKRYTDCQNLVFPKPEKIVDVRFGSALAKNVTS